MIFISFHKIVVIYILLIQCVESEVGYFVIGLYDVFVHIIHIHYIN